LPGLEGGVVGPLDGKGGLEVAVVVKANEPIVEESGEFHIFGGGNGAGFPLARVERGFGELDFEAERAAVDGVFGSEEVCRSEDEKSEEENLLETAK
jgi:hypothetical protein